MKFPLSLGEGASKTLAAAWSHRMQFLFDANEDGLLDNAEKRDRALEEYSKNEPEDFKELMISGSEEVQLHGKRIRSITGS